MDAVIAVFTTIKGGFKKPCTPPVNDALVRVLGTELQPLINQQRAINEALEEIYQQLAIQVHNSNPCTDEGKDLERMLLDYLHSMGTRATADLEDVAGRMRAFKTPSPVAAAAMSPTMQPTMKESAHA